MARYATPLRYPGGKQKLTPFILEILEANSIHNGEYVEPYAGGAGVAIELLVTKAVRRIYLNDCSLPVYAFWKSLVTQPDELCRRIAGASLTVDEWKRCREIVRLADPTELLNLGFATFFLNRCNRSGVLSGGLIGGLQQTGKWLMDARFNRNDLMRRIELVAGYANSIEVSNLDAEKFLEGLLGRLSDRALVYCDPPYYEKAKGLYLNNYKADDHSRFAKFIQSYNHANWVVSYDGVPEILSLYPDHKSILYDLQYSAARAYKGKEVFIFSNQLSIPTSSSLEYIQRALEVGLQDTSVASHAYA